MRTVSRSFLALRVLPLCLSLVSIACAYPRRETMMHPAPPDRVRIEDRPKDMWTIQIVDAELPEFKAGGLPWDSDGTEPDPFVRIYVAKRLIWESPVRKDTRKPAWHFTLPRNVQIDESASFRVELWDHDTAVSADPAGAIQREGLPSTALPDALARLTLDNLGMLSMVASAPRAQQGAGLRFEVRSDALVVLDVEHFSPAFRAGILKGQRIVAIGPQRVSELGGDEAASDLSLANDRGTTLTIEDEKGHERQVTLDKGFIWLVM
jgi:C2 domain